MKRLTGLFLAWLLLSCSIHALAAEPCRLQNLGFDQKTAGWTHLPLSKVKNDTVYTQDQAQGQTILRGTADNAASLLVSLFPSTMEVPARISWRWKTDALVPGADNLDKNREDASLRVIVAFDGDHATLPEVEQKRFRRAKFLSGREPPYAMLMYIWSANVPENTVIPSAHTSQVRMLVVSSDQAGLGRWQTIKRNLADDYRQVFGNDPGPVIGVAVMTDSDNTGTRATGEYADIIMECSEGGAN